MAKADGAVPVIARKKSLGAELKTRYATVKDVDRIVKDLNFFYIKCANASTTTDFGALEVGDLVIQIPDAAATMHYMTVATAGTLPETQVVDDLYIVLRPSA
jgi:ethanolamine utilization protein EutQ (cupin superfamily)